jgi:uncharacterized membrane protein
MTGGKVVSIALSLLCALVVFSASLALAALLTWERIAMHFNPPNDPNSGDITTPGTFFLLTVLMPIYLLVSSVLGSVAYMIVHSRLRPVAKFKDE